MEEERKYRLDILFGEVRLSSRWEPCSCGRVGCGRYINRTVETGYGGKILKDSESPGLSTRYEDCTGHPSGKTISSELMLAQAYAEIYKPRRQSFFERLFG
jgi:hypothetical protein